MTDFTLFRKKMLTKKKSYRLPGISSSALQEAKEIFGDVDELLMLRKQGLASSASDISCTEKRLEDEFEPFVLSEKYMTLKDVVIRGTDVPERIQVTQFSFLYNLGQQSCLSVNLYNLVSCDVSFVVV